MYRKKINKNNSKKLFKRTATRTKKVNISGVGMRGGIRL